MNNNAKYKIAQYDEAEHWEQWKNSVKFEKERKEKGILDNYTRFMLIPHGHELAFFNGKTIVEVGCGVNPVIAFGELQAKKCYCIDPLINEYKQIINYNDLGMESIRSNAEEIPLSSDSIDVLLCLNAIEYMYEPVKTLLEFRRVLSEHGELYIRFVFDKVDDACHSHSLGLDEILKNFADAELYIWQSDIRCVINGVLKPQSATVVCRKYSKK